MIVLVEFLDSCWLRFDFHSSLKSFFRYDYLLLRGKGMIIVKMELRSWKTSSYIYLLPAYGHRYFVPNSEILP
jgi:hypothetical protein